MNFIYSHHKKIHKGLKVVMVETADFGVFPEHCVEGCDASFDTGITDDITQISAENFP